MVWIIAPRNNVPEDRKDAMSTVELRSVHKSYGPTKVIENLSLSVNDGEFLALVGPSGCGKSTLLRMIAGLEDITRGTVSIDGKVINDLDPRRRNIAMVFQNYALYPHMTVRKNISLNLEIAKVPKKEVQERVQQAAQLLDIESLLDRRPGQLSGGQRQRVAMGRAIVRNPSVFLFDEPLSNLDAKLRVQMRAEIKAFHQKVQTTSIYVTHDQIEAMTLADRIVVLNAGNIEQIGTPTELYATPQNTFVANFIGSPAMNFWDGVVAQSPADGSAVRLGDGTEIALPLRLDAANDEPVVVGVRPENLSLADGGIALPATVNLVEPTGAQTYLLLQCAGRSATVSVNGATRLKPGESVKVFLDPAHIHVFSKTSGRRISRTA